MRRRLSGLELEVVGAAEGEPRDRSSRGDGGYATGRVCRIVARPMHPRESPAELHIEPGSLYGVHYHNERFHPTTSSPSSADIGDARSDATPMEGTRVNLPSADRASTSHRIISRERQLTPGTMIGREWVLLGELTVRLGLELEPCRSVAGTGPDREPLDES